MRNGLLTATVATAMALAACASDDGRSARSTEPRSGPDQLAAAERTLVERCLRRRGIESAPKAPELATPAPEAQYGLEDAAWAARHGFGEQPASGAHGQRLDARTATALFGAEDGPRIAVEMPDGATVTTATTGCLAEVRHALFGDLERWFRADIGAQTARLVSQRRVFRSRPYRARLAAWSRCVRRAGVTARSPGALRRQALRRRAPVAVQRRWAVAEAECVTETGLAALGRRLEARARRNLDADLRHQLQAFRALEQRALRRAMSLAAGGTR